MLHVSDQAMRNRAGFAATSAVASDMNQALAGELAELARYASEPSPFCEPWFLGPALRFLRDGSDVNLVEVRNDDGRLLGIIPLCLAQNYGRLPVRHVSNWMHYQCFIGSPLVRVGTETQFWRAVIIWLDHSAWATGLLRIAGLVDGGPLHAGLAEAAHSLSRRCPVIHRYDRAVLASPLDGPAYLGTFMRPKKRKELRRLANRLAALGDVVFECLQDSASIDEWCNHFLTIEAAGWKGNRGAALRNHAHTASFFHHVVRGGMAAGRIDFQRLTLNGRPIAMLVNFLTPPGSWSFKIAYDESFARYSPGVMIELENLCRVLDNDHIDWMDSCAVENHPMINSLWAQRRTICQVAIPLRGVRRMLTFHTCRTIETVSAKARQLGLRTYG